MLKLMGKNEEAAFTTPSEKLNHKNLSAYFFPNEYATPSVRVV
jgi:hypothetical protein